ncbi:MAG: hypothetical protein MJ072_02325, partial [Clostridia bacterium]|nr:hypothetical protein [Clostridia bacterium]
MEKKFYFFKKVSISFLLSVLCAICLFFAFNPKPQSVLAGSDPLAEANVHFISELNSNGGKMQDGEWWIVDKNFNYYYDLEVSGSVHLLLNDGVTFKLSVDEFKFDTNTDETL